MRQYFSCKTWELQELERQETGSECHLQLVELNTTLSIRCLFFALPDLGSLTPHEIA
ncbi:hypothetical protein ALQ62_200203 [Pseudomonas coronafaciens pv. zizaniae]|nr:hypothetical protein ALO38_200118 [Pseudomonas coronafaciens pv. zizaniae]RMN24560.1 hypothetical protein ALQ62_200203 [Pseudomonas coronafaciens pv. zizaniae]